MHRFASLLLLLFVLFFSAHAEETQSMPFTIRTTINNASLGVEALLEMDSTLRAIGIRDIYVGAQFPVCTSVSKK